MFTLIVKEEGKKEKVYTLEEGSPSFIGRREGNLISLDASYGISRKHIQIEAIDEDSWKVECLSNLGGLIFNGKEVSECIIKNNDSFSLQQFTFTLQQTNQSVSQKINLQEEEKEEEAPAEESEQDSPELSEKSQLPSFAPDLKQSQMKEEEDSQFTKAQTVMPQLNNYLKPYLIVSLSEEEEDQVIELSDRDLWIVGRDPSSDICIEDVNISRHHFKIRKTGLNFFIEDLKSSNGTSINGKLIRPQTSTPLNSGDVISVLNIEIYFEIRNVDFEKKNENAIVPVKPSSSNDLLSLSEGPEQSPNTPAIIPNAVLSETIMTPIPKKSSKRRLIVISTVLIVIGGALYFKSQSEDKKQVKEEGAEEGALGALSQEKQEKIKNLYVLAQQQYQMKKFELCNQTLKELHSVTPFYQESQDLIVACQSGAESIKIQLEIQNQKKQEEAERKKLKSIVTNCKNKFNSFKTLAQLEGCLAEAITIDPEDEELNILRLDFETKETTRKQRQDEITKLRKRVRTEKSIYDKAKKLKSKNQLLKAISAYKKFLLRDHPPTISQLVKTAREELFEMEETIQQKINSFMSECQELMETRSYKKAYSVCQKVFAVSPKNKKATEAVKRAQEELSEQLRPLFNESIINESLGQVEIAKKQWVIIIERDIPKGKYALKAKRKLNKY